MDAKVNYTIVGIFVIVLSIAFIYILFWLTSGESSKYYNTYLAYMKESVSGLSAQSPVKYNGVKVGFVADISLNPKDPTQVRLVLEIESDIPIRSDTTATLEVQGLTGIAYIGLSGGAPNAAILTVKPGQEYPVIQTRPSLLLRLDTALRNLTGNLDSITNGVKSILDQNNQENIKATLTNLKKFTTTLANNSSQIDATLKNLNQTIDNMKKASTKFPELIDTTEATMKTIRIAAKNVVGAVSQINVTLRKGRIAIENIADQITPQLYTTLGNISDLSLKFKGFTAELKQNPSMLIRGKFPATPGPGEQIQ